MMTRYTLPIAILFTLFAKAQKLNPAGHLISISENKSRTIHSTNGTEVQVGAMKLKGNTAFITNHGIVTLNGEDDFKQPSIRIHDLNGDEIFLIQSSQVINFTISTEGNYAAFHDMQQLHLIDIERRQEKILTGSNVFAVNDDGVLAYYNDENQSLNFNDLQVSANETVYRCLFFNTMPLFVTLNKIITINDGTPEIIFTAPEGRIFDTEVFGDELYISTKNHLSDKFIFKSYSSSDFIDFNQEEEVEYPLANKSGSLRKSNETSSSTSIIHESFLNPLHYYLDTVFQEVGNSYSEIQEYITGSPYLHEGVDLIGYFMQDVYAVKKGYVKAILTINAQYHWRIAISNENTSGESQGYLYAHLEELSIPYAVGDSVNEGDVVGYLVDFPVQDFVHCHFARILCQGNTWGGDWWTFDNPLSYMINHFDSIPPEFEKTINNEVFAFTDVNGNYLSPDSLFGNIKIISKVHDRINSSWHVDVDKLRYNLSPLASPHALLVDTHAYTYSFFNDGYFTGTYSDVVMNAIYSRDGVCHTTADWVVRDFYHVITNSDGNDTITASDALQLFPTANFPDGSYILRVIAHDPSGNSAMDSMVIELRNGITQLSSITSAPLLITPNPFSSVAILQSPQNISNAYFTLYDRIGRQVLQIQNITGSEFKIHRGNLTEGLYSYRLQEKAGSLFQGRILIMGQE